MHFAQSYRCGQGDGAMGFDLMLAERLSVANS